MLHTEETQGKQQQRQQEQQQQNHDLSVWISLSSSLEHHMYTVADHMELMAQQDSRSEFSEESYKEALQQKLRRYKPDIFPTGTHFSYGGPMTVLQVLVGVPILYGLINLGMDLDHPNPESCPRPY